jgi:hypothetical protein
MPDISQVVSARDSELYRDNFIQSFLPDLLVKVSEHFLPEEIFDKEKLDEWAKANGYVDDERRSDE